MEQLCKIKPLVGRILLATVFLLSGYGKITNFDGAAGFIAYAGLPLPEVVLVLVILLEILAGLSLLVGFKTKWSALALAGFTVLATAIFHRELGDSIQQLFFMKNLGIIGGLLYVAAFGAGAYSIDNKKGESTPPPPPAAPSAE